MSNLTRLQTIISQYPSIEESLLTRALVACIIGEIKTDKQLAEFLNISREQAFFILNNNAFSSVIVEQTMQAQKRKFVLQKLVRLNKLTKSNDHKVALGAIKLLAQLTGLLKEKLDVNVTVNLETILEEIEERKKNIMIDITPESDDFTLDDCFK